MSSRRFFTSSVDSPAELMFITSSLVKSSIWSIILFIALILFCISSRTLGVSSAASLMMFDAPSACTLKSLSQLSTAEMKRSYDICGGWKRFSISSRPTFYFTPNSTLRLLTSFSYILSESRPALSATGVSSTFSVLVSFLGTLTSDTLFLAYLFRLNVKKR